MTELAHAPPRRTLHLVVAVRPADALGFRLAGAEVAPFAAGDEAADWKRATGDAGVGVLAVEEEVLAAVPERLVRRVRSRGLPVLLPFALPRRWSEAGKGQAYVAAIIRRAVGYGVKLAGPGGEP